MSGRIAGRIIFCVGGIFASGMGLAQTEVPPLVPAIDSVQRALPERTAPAEVPPTAGETGVVDMEYVVGPNDLLRIDVFQVPEFARTVRVSSGGLISLPLIGNVKASGLTAAQLEKRVADRLSETYMQNPYVTIFIEDYASQRVTVEGQVVKPGIYALSGRTTLLQVVALAQGLHDVADANKVQVFRNRVEGEREVLVYDVEAIRRGEVSDPQVLADDVIIVHKAGFRATMKHFTDTLRGFIYFGGTL